ncbi:MAG: YIP1 family protein [Bacillota bacterium]
MDEAPAPALSGPLELIYAVLFQPLAAFARAAARPPLGLAAASVVVVYSLNGIMSGINLTRLGGEGLAVTGLAIVTPLAGLFTWVAVTAALHFTAELLGGSGRSVALLAALGLATLVTVFNLPAALVGMAGVTWLQVLLNLGITVWTLTLFVIALRAVYGLSFARAVLALVIPGAAFAAFLVILAVYFALVLAAVLPLINKQFPGFPGL